MKKWATPKKSPAQLVTDYKTALTRDNQVNWKKGDLALIVTRNMQTESDRSERRKQLDDFLAETGETEKSFYNLRWMAQTYPTWQEREIPVSWTHFRIAADLPTQQRRALLERAAAQQWPTRRLEQEVRAIKAALPVHLTLMTTPVRPAHVRK